ncbi:hypothetical protein PIB30_099965 [Stylosanthes scabra]|uniref:RRM domain-containing protein n=1 Tax=Stylosanthes scabra TaxID=79078 RepID=A0ABU6UZR6_9FABA|nr:hypothetical protein [Stylosanthes scabra]
MRARDGERTISARWWERNERGIHDDGSDFAGRKNKGESVGVGVLGVRGEGGKGYKIFYKVKLTRGQRDEYMGNYRSGLRNNNTRGARPIEERNKWLNLEEKTHSIFVDNLPDRFLYNEFGKHGCVRDVFLSRKQRKARNGPFAFIRYDALGDVVRVIRRLNGTRWGNRVISVKKAETCVPVEK